MAHVCKEWCKLGKTQCMLNLKSCIAYEVANRCSQCSDNTTGVWYLKWVNICPCCRNMLRRKPKHKEGRAKMVLLEERNRSVNKAQML